MAAAVINPIKKAGSGVDWVLPAAAVAMVFVMLIPMPAMLLDLMLALSIKSSSMAGIGMSITKTMATAAAGRTQSTPEPAFLIGLITAAAIMLLPRYVASPAPVRDKRTPESPRPRYKVCWESRCPHPRSDTGRAPAADFLPWGRYSIARSA